MYHMKINRHLQLLTTLFVLTTSINTVSNNSEKKVSIPETTHKEEIELPTAEPSSPVATHEAKQVQEANQDAEDQSCQEDRLVADCNSEEINVIEVASDALPEYVTICNAITDQSKQYTCKWGTFAPDKFSVRLIIDFEPNQSVSIPKKMIESGNVQAEYNFAFNKGIASRKGTRSQVLSTSDNNQEQNLLFSWEEPRFQLQAKRSA